MQIKWSKQTIISEIYNIAHRDSSFFAEVPKLDSEYVREKYPKLFRATLRHFGSYEAAVEAAGFNYEKIRKTKKRSQEQIIKEIQKMIFKEPLNHDYVRKNHLALFCAAKKYFGSWPNAIKTVKKRLNIDLDYEKIKGVHRRWSKEGIVSEIQRLYEEGKNLNMTSIKKLYPELVWAAQKSNYFGSWKNAVKATGLNYEGITNEQRKIGTEKRLALKKLEQLHKERRINQEIFGERLEIGILADKEENIECMKKEIRNMAKESGYENAIDFQINYIEGINEDKLYSCSMLPVKFIPDEKA